MAAVKVCVVGPAGAGKTALCKLLAGRAVPETRTHDPTEGVRIEEVERDIDGKTVSVQLWDCSGDLAYETSHPAMRLGLDALVLVRDAEDPAGDGALELWHDTFAFGGGTDDGLAVEKKLLVRVGKMSDANDANASPPNGVLAGVRVVRGSLEQKADIEALVKETRAALDGVLAEVTRARTRRGNDR